MARCEKTWEVPKVPAGVRFYLVQHLPLGDDGRRSGRVGVVADDWRVTVTFRDEADVQQAVQFVREHEVEDDVRSRLGHRVAMSVDGPAVFLYAGTEDTAREAERVVREVRRSTS